MSFAIGLGMKSESSSAAIEIGRTLCRLCCLELPKIRLRKILTERERLQGIEFFRKRLPISILNHHDRMLQKGRASIAGVTQRGHCLGCGERVERETWERLRSGYGLELCDHCGSFLFKDVRHAERMEDGTLAVERKLATAWDEKIGTAEIESQRNVSTTEQASTNVSAISGGGRKAG